MPFRRSLGSLWGWVLVLAVTPAGVGCDRSERQDHAEDAVPALSLEPAVPVGSTQRLEFTAPLASHSAFDLVATLDGATLVYAKGRGAASLFTQDIDRDGGLKGKPRLALPGDRGRGTFSELVAERLDAALAVAWIERQTDEARASAIFFDGDRIPDVIDLGPAFHTNRIVRGNLALAATRDYALSFMRGLPEACAAGQRGCFGFSLRKLDKGGSASARGLPLVVPVPCVEHATGLSVVAERWHYAVCTLQDEKPVTTVFSIQFAPEYAKAEQYLPGCRPLGLFSYQGKVWLSAECAGGRRLARIHARPRQEYDLSLARLRCRANVLGLEAGEFQLKFKRRMSQAHVLLSQPWVPPLSRAVWTGRVLLVAQAEQRGLSLISYRCS